MQECATMITVRLKSPSASDTDCNTQKQRKQANGSVVA